MTVKELIDHLDILPQDMTILCLNKEKYLIPVSSVKIASAQKMKYHDDYRLKNMSDNEFYETPIEVIIIN